MNFSVGANIAMIFMMAIEQEYEEIDENGKKLVTLEELVHGAGLSFLGEIK